ncbi:MAG: hypothetical protein P9F75_17405, partial [Candidatus Contendobacter sp.]|nr:hypothetical protein [Candidatus Contendobacter sp.]
NSPNVQTQGHIQRFEPSAPWRSATLKPFLRRAETILRSNKRRPNYDATLHNLELISKAATHLPNTVRYEIIFHMISVI